MKCERILQHVAKIIHEDCYYSIMRLLHNIGLPRRKQAELRVKQSNLHVKRIASSAFGLLAMTLFLMACLPLNSTPATATPLPTDTALPTETIVWFPPSATPTPLMVPTYTG